MTYIECRDDTIKLLDERVARQGADIGRLREALDQIRRGTYDGLEVTHLTAASCRSLARQALGASHDA